MKLRCNGYSSKHEFEKIALKFGALTYRDVFAKKNNKSVCETLKHKQYADLDHETRSKYSSSLGNPLGQFLLRLKQQGDVFYKQFLNKYGDLEYSKFWISDPKYLEIKGVYAYFSGDNLKYIGRCRDSMNKRVNQGYGKIHPKNCYRDGQATNCHLNAKITSECAGVTLWLYESDSDLEIETLEKEFIRSCNPQWNIQR